MALQCLAADEGGEGDPPDHGAGGAGVGHSHAGRCPGPDCSRFLESLQFILILASFSVYFSCHWEEVVADRTSLPIHCWLGYSTVSY